MYNLPYTLQEILIFAIVLANIIQTVLSESQSKNTLARKQDQVRFQALQECDLESVPNNCKSTVLYLIRCFKRTVKSIFYAMLDIYIKIQFRPCNNYQLED